MKRSAVHALAAGLGLAALGGCAAPYSSGPTTTTTTVVRDANGVPIASGTTTRDSYGNTVASTPTGLYQSSPGYPVQQYPAQPYPAQPYPVQPYRGF